MRVWIALAALLVGIVSYLTPPPPAQCPAYACVACPAPTPCPPAACPPASCPPPPPPPPPAAPARRVVFVSGEPGPASAAGNAHRVVRAAAAVKLAGWEAAAVPITDLESEKARGNAFAGAAVVVVWRAPWGPLLESVYGAARAAGAKVAYDLDDMMLDPALADPKFIDAVRFHDAAGIRDLYSRVRDAALRADFCLAPTRPLAEAFAVHAKPAYLVPNGYTAKGLALAERLHARGCGSRDGRRRIGYASGTLTHQADLREALPALVRLMGERDDLRLVFFRGGIDLAEFPDLEPYRERIELRDPVPVGRTIEEVCRFDVNIVPLQINPFTDAKSELKFHEAALLRIPTAASPTAPHQESIEHGVNGVLCANATAWYARLSGLLDDRELAAELGQRAYESALWRFSPERRGRLYALAFKHALAEEHEAAMVWPAYAAEIGTGPGYFHELPEDYHAVFDSEDGKPPPDGTAEVAVILASYNQAGFLNESLASILAQRDLASIEVIAVDDLSPDASAGIIAAWMRLHAPRFRRAILLRPKRNAGLAASRNAALTMARAPFAMILDADNHLLPDCIHRLLAALKPTDAAFAFPVLQQFGDAKNRMGALLFSPAVLAGGNQIDAMVLLRRSAWAAAGGYRQFHGWEDYRMWLAMSEKGMYGIRLGGEPAAGYRVRLRGSMSAEDSSPNRRGMNGVLRQERRWLYMGKFLRGGQ
ncbi:nucleotide-diphospho-sugar transferase [Hyaloraphidium curvatum]|nr:nucleotide-diphospho-sugar transferase [Hyaloraphidium curvatum]